MAFYKQDIVDIDLNSGNIFRSFLNHSIGYKDDDADRFGVRVFRDKEPVDLSGASCEAVFMAPNGVNIALTSYGTVSGNEAFVTLPQACYDYEGQFCLAIKLVGGGVTGTVRIIDGMVINTGASGAVAPTASVPTYQEILSTYDAMVAATSAANLAIAEEFDASKNYPAGKNVINDGALYVLPNGHTAGTTWANTTKVASNLGDQVSELKSALNFIRNWNGTNYLCIESAISGKSINNQGQLQDGAARVQSTKDYLPIDSEETYYISTNGNADNLLVVAFYNSAKTYIDRVIGVSSFTTPENCSFIRVTVDKENGFPDLMQISKGSIVPYSPYYKTDVNHIQAIDLESRAKNGELQDEVDNLIVNNLAYKVITDSTVTSAGQIIPYSGASRTEYIPILNRKNIKVYQPNKTNCFVSFFDDSKGFISPRNAVSWNDENPLSIPANAKYFIVSGVSSVFDGIQVYTELGQTVKDILEKGLFVNGINLLPNEIHFNEDYTGQGEASANPNYLWFEIPVNIEQAEWFGCYTVASNGTLTEIKVYGRKVDGEGTETVIGNPNYLSEYRIEADTKKLIIGMTTTNYKSANIIVCKAMYASLAYPVDAIQYRRYIITDDESKQVIAQDRFEIIGFDDPYAYLDPYNNFSFKFNSMHYRFNGFDYSYSFNEAVADLGYPVVDYNYEYMNNVYLFGNATTNKLLFNPNRNKIRVSTTTLDSDIVLFEINENGYWDGELVRAHLKYKNERLIPKQQLTKDMIDSINTKIDTLYGNLDNSIITFGYISDDHHQYDGRTGEDYSGMALNYVDKTMDFDMVLDAGDTILTSNQPVVTNPLNALRESYGFLPMEKMCFVQGNHDRNVSPVLNKKDFFEITYRKYRNDPSYHFGNPPASYYYKDFEKFKIRLVVLDLYDIPAEYNYNDHPGYRQDQLEWLCNTALRINSDWSVIVASHSAPYNDEEGMTGNTGPQENAELLRTILYAFKHGTNEHLSATGYTDQVFVVDMDANFASQGERTLIGMFTGHNHYDVILEKDGITYVSIMCGYIDVLIYLDTRIQDTYSAIAFDVVQINTTTRTVTFKRIGYGSDRSFTY